MDNNTYELNEIIERLEESFELDQRLKEIVNKENIEKMDSAKLFLTVFKNLKEINDWMEIFKIERNIK